jgi:hypothetical protein
MRRADRLFSDIEVFRTPEEMKLYFESKVNIIKNDVEYSSLARLKKGLFKEFLEEFYPLYCFSQSRFCFENSKLKIVIGNQGYDAIIINPDGTETRLEFTSYIDGKFEFEDAKLLNSRGYGNIKFNDFKDLESRALGYISKIMQNAKKKSEKSYKGVSIIFVVNTFDYFEVYENSSKVFVELLKEKLKKMRFNADNIYLLISNDKKISEIDNNIYIVK